MQETKLELVLRALASLVLGCALSLSALAAAPQDLSKAEELYTHTDYEGSLALLDKHSTDATTAFLLGRDYFMLADFKKATEYLQKATAADPGNSEYMDWLGRAFGRRAETANPLSAMGLASKARQAFERSVELNPKNSDALSDLFDYYLDAPKFMGGGYDKALAVAQKISAVDPPEGYFEEARLAEKRNQLPSAEEHLRQAVAAAPHEVGLMISLAKFLAGQGRIRESDEVFEAAQQVKPDDARVWFARADLLIKQNRDLEEAKNLLQKYVRAPVTVEDPPKEEAVRLLKQVGGA